MKNSNDMAAITPGRVLGDRYTIREPLGAGAFSIVYVAFDQREQDECAVKVFTFSAIPPGPSLDRFWRELDLLHRLNHPAVVGVRGHGFTKPRNAPFIAMELVRGDPLEEQLKCRGALGLSETLRIAEALGDALTHAAEAGIVHRDIKASNVMIEHGSRRCVLIDFGIAVQPRGGLRVTDVGEIVGTPANLAPEQIVTGVPVDHRTDVYQLGALLYQVLTGKLPFEAPNHAALAHQIVARTPTPVSHRMGGGSPVVDHVLARALEKIPDARYQTTQELVTAFRSAVQLPLTPHEESRSTSDGEATADHRLPLAE